MKNNNLDNSKIAIVIPYFNASNQIISVISKFPEYINVVIIVNDKSVEPLPKKEILETLNKNIECYFQYKTGRNLPVLPTNTHAGNACVSRNKNGIESLLGNLPGAVVTDADQKL